MSASTTKIEEEITLPDIISDYKKLTELSEKLKEIEVKIEALYEEWMVLT